MPIAVRAHSLMLVVVGLVAALIAVPVGVPGALGVPGPVQVVDLPARDRVDPRDAQPVGLTTDFGVVTWREPDPAPQSHTAAWMVQVLVDGGSTSSLDRQVQAVFGNRLVAAPMSPPVSAVESRLLPSASWTSTAVPSGWFYLDATADGLLVVQQSEPTQLAIVAWGTTGLVPVAGVPADTTSLGAIGESEQGSAPHGTILRIGRGPSGADWLYVDTAAAKAWSLNLVGGGPCALDAASSTPWGLHDGALAWHANTVDGQGRHQICRLTLPVGAESVAAPTVRPVATSLTDVVPWQSLGVLPWGSNVAVWRLPTFGIAGGWPASTEMPVRAITPDGTLLSVAGWGHSVRQAQTGSILFVGGAAPASVAVRTASTPTDSIVLADLPPVAATFLAIAVDGRQVDFIDDSASRHALVENHLDDVGQWTDGAGALVDSSVTKALAARDGSLAWANADPASMAVGDIWNVRTPDDVTHSGPAFSSGITQAQLRAVSGPWLLRLYAGRDYLLDAVTGDYAVTRALDAKSDLLDSVHYLPNTRVPGAPDNVVVARDLTTHQGALVPTPGCVKSSAVRAAGSWLLLSCGGGSTFETMVLDRSGLWPTRGVPADVELGNGFLVRADVDGFLEWADLNSSAELSWQPVDVSAEPLAADLTSGIDAWAVSSSADPTVAWFSRRQARIAILPVATSPVAARPTGVTAPSSPTGVTVDPIDRAVTVDWSAAPDADGVLAYEVRVGTKVLTVPGTATSGTVFDLTNGQGYSVSVTAINAAGEAVSAPIQATPLAPPAAPTNVDVTVDPLTSEATVTWDWSAVPNSETLTGFEIWSSAPEATVGADARQGSFVVPEPGSGTLHVYAVGERQNSGAATDVLQFPGVDHVSPTARVKDVAKVVLGTSTSANVVAADDRQLASVDVRIRSAAFGARLGPWQRPAAWQGRTPGALVLGGLEPGRTYCLSARAVDHAGNIGEWSAARCSVVPIDDRALSATGWRKVNDPRWYGGTAVRAADPSSVLKTGRIVAVEAWVVATTCRTCGKVAVLVNGVRVGVFDLWSARTRYRQILRMPTPGVLSGRITLSPVASAGPVIIEGFALRSF